jgi:hypothetical protein
MISVRFVPAAFAVVLVVATLARRVVNSLVEV